MIMIAMVKNNPVGHQIQVDHHELKWINYA